MSFFEAALRGFGLTFGIGFADHTRFNASSKGIAGVSSFFSGGLFAMATASVERTLKVTKLDAGRRQLSTAITMWQYDVDPVSAHTLAFAAYQVLHDLNRRAKGPTLLLDNKHVAPDKRQAYVDSLKFFATYFKHADDRKKKKKADPPEVTFDPSITELFLLFAVDAAKVLKQKLTAQETAFVTWMGLERPHLVTPEFRQFQEDTFGLDILKSARGHPKKEFFDLLVKDAAESGEFLKTRYTD